MGSRYVWNKYEIDDTWSQDTVNITKGAYLTSFVTNVSAVGYVCADVEMVYDETSRRLIGWKAVAPVQPLYYGAYLPANTYPYFVSTIEKPVTMYAQSGAISGTHYWYGMRDYRSGNGNYGAALIVLNVGDTSSNARYFSEYNLITRRGELIGPVSSASKSTYPTTSGGAISNNYWYEYLGYDNIDPSSVSISYSGKLEPGKSISVNISPRSPAYGGNISYLYQYSVDGGGWESIQTTTAVSVDFTIPETAKKIQFRVRAQDDIGFTSSSYISTSAYVLEHLDLWVGVNGKARKGVAMYVGVNGKARKVTAAYIGVNGKARRFL